MWTKPQEIPQLIPGIPVELAAEPMHFTFTMVDVATPTSAQSEAYIATAALFFIFNGNNKEGKVNLRLPPTWQDLWTKLADIKKSQLDARGREAVRELRDLVRERKDQELEDGVILHGAFKGRGAGKGLQNIQDENNQDFTKSNPTESEALKKIWANKAGTPKFEAMLVSWRRAHITFLWHD